MICYLSQAPTYFFFTPNLPDLLYYSHFSTLVGSLIVGLFVYVNGRKFLLNKLLFLMTVCFSAWVLVNLITWTNIHGDIISLVWPLFAALAALISILSIYIVEVFVTKRDVFFRTKAIFLALLLPVFTLGFSDMNFSGFDITNCDPFRFSGLAFQTYYTILGFIAMIWIAYLIIKNYKTADRDFKKQLILMGAGVESFIMIFFGFDFLATYLSKLGIFQDSRMEFFGLFSMFVFLTFIAILIVRFKAFSIKILAPSALVVALVFLVGTQYTYVTTLTGKILTSVTLFLVCLIGILLVRSVRKEVKAREKIEALAKELDTKNIRLQELDKQKSEFVSFATHQLRSPLAAMRGNASLILEGDTGAVNDQTKEIVKTIETSAKTLSTVVEDYLNISRIELGTMKYDLKEMDFKDLVKEVVNEQKPNIESRGLSYSVSMDESQTYKIKVDPDKFKQVIMNIVDNSVKYTPQGSLAISLEKNTAKNTIRFKVSDTGVGIDPAVMPKLFQKFSRADNAHEANIHGTGLGLFIAKDIVKAHNGDVWAESEGEGKGSQFYVEVPEVK